MPGITFHSRALSRGTQTFTIKPDGVGIGFTTQDTGVHREEHYSFEQYETLQRLRPDIIPALPANGNTIGRVVGQPAAPKTPAAKANPPVKPETPQEASTGTKLLDGLQLGLDVVGLIPGVGEIADLANAGISAARGDYVSAGISAAAAIPFVGWGATAAKAGKRGMEAADAVKSATKAKAASEATAKAGDEAAEQLGKRGDDAAGKTDTAGGSGKDGGKVEGKGKCILRPYSPDTCKAEGKTGHHVVPDRAFRLGKRAGPDRNPIPGGLTEAEGLVICVEGATPMPTNQHGKIHGLYNKAEKAIGLAGDPPGTAPLKALEAAGAAAAAKVMGCNPASLLAQLRTYHQAKGLGPDFKVRADERGTLARKLPLGTFGTQGPGDF